MQLIGEYGFDNISVGLIAERADIARGTFFNHFHSKDDLISEWSGRRRDLLIEKIGALPVHSSAADRLHACFVVLAEINCEDSQVTRHALKAWVRTAGPIIEAPYGATIIEQIIEDGVKSGEFRPDVNVGLVGHALRDLYLGVLYRRLDRLSDLEGLRGELLESLELVLPALAPLRDETPADQK